MEALKDNSSFSVSLIVFSVDDEEEEDENKKGESDEEERVSSESHTTDTGAASFTTNIYCSCKIFLETSRTLIILLTRVCYR